VFGRDGGDRGGREKASEIYAVENMLPLMHFCATAAKNMCGYASSARATDADIDTKIQLQLEIQIQKATATNEKPTQETLMTASRRAAQTRGRRSVTGKEVAKRKAKDQNRTEQNRKEAKKGKQGNQSACCLYNKASQPRIIATAGAQIIKLFKCPTKRQNDSDRQRDRQRDSSSQRLETEN